MKTAKIRRRLPIGAEVQPQGGVHFRVWAPRRRKVEVVLEEGAGNGRESEPSAFPLTREKGGYFSGYVENASDGACYWFRLDGENLYADPVSRSQPQGITGPSQVVDPALFRWTDQEWKGVTARGQVIYEMHIGTYTAEGNWDGAIRQLPAIAETGVTLLEIMPVAEFAG
ncbi:MAG TPA: malto-oligosyltrehalose trehalohydrolase, partial [Acidobacteriota bacterium]|nr:malto-oligosyltrehalose trehalohydrolase [Acidobacteriota bacterium]